MYRILELILVICCLVLPVYAYAQDDGKDSEGQDIQLPRTMQDNFRGWYLGGELHIGTAQYMGDGLDEVDHSFWYPAGKVELEASYLWGCKVFIGPEITIGAGYPYKLTTDVRLKFVVPFKEKDALTFGIGWGVTWFQHETDEPIILKTKRMTGDKEHKIADFVTQMYLPTRIGYEHVYGNGFVLGASLEAIIDFGKKETRYSYDAASGREPTYEYDGTSIIDTYDGKKEQVHLYFSQVTVGLHLGYKF